MTQRLLVKCRAGDISQERQLAISGRQTNYLCLLDTGSLLKGLDNLARLDPNATYFQLFVHAAVEYELAIAPLTCKIAGSIKTLTGLEGAGDEVRGRQAGAIPISASKTIASDVLLPDLARTAKRQLLVEQIDACARNWHPDWRRIVSRLHACGRAKDCRFSRTVFIEESNIGQSVVMPPDQSAAKWIAADNNSHQIDIQHHVLLGKQRCISRRSQHDGPNFATPARNERMEIRQIDPQCQRPASTQRPEDQRYRYVKRER
ncbi:hypothetical protein R70199_07300 [Paraburkholderia domus]|nr:hypothetical protein R70199_07300 [Paraburkholderia domus]